MKSSPQLSRRDFLVATTVLAVGPACSGLGGVGTSESDYQLGCYTRPWDQFDYRVALDGIAEAGFKYAGIMTAKGKSWVIITVDSTPEEVATIAEEVKKRELKTISVYGGDFPVAKSIDAGIAGLKKLIDYCAICGCPNLLLGGTTEPRLVEPYYRVVAESCDYAALKHVGLSIKPHGGQNATGSQCRQLIEQVAHRNFRLWYDPGNIFYYSDGKLDPVQDSSAVNGLVVGMSVKDFKPPKEVLVTPGTGQVRFGQVLSNLKNGGFSRGPLVVECLDRASDPKKINGEARKALEFLNSTLKQIG